jgi:hypothetical protein
MGGYDGKANHDPQVRRASYALEDAVRHEPHIELFPQAKGQNAASRTRATHLESPLTIPTENQVNHKSLSRRVISDDAVWSCFRDEGGTLT